jgi:hypothetical protein
VAWATHIGTLQDLTGWNEIRGEGWLYVPSGTVEADQKLFDPYPSNGAANLYVSYLPGNTVDGTKYWATRWSNGYETVYVCEAWGDPTDTTPTHAPSGKVTGTTDAGGNSTTLIDSGAFASYTFAAGDLAYNLTDGSFAQIVSKDSSNQVTTNALKGGTANTFANGDVYSIVAKDSGRWLHMPKDRWVRETIHLILRADTKITGDTTLGSATITNMSNTAAYAVNSYVTVTAGFGDTSQAWAGQPYRVVSKDASSLTLESTARSTNTGVTVCTANDTIEIYINGIRRTIRASKVGATPATHQGASGSNYATGVLRYSNIDNFNLGPGGLDDFSWWLTGSDPNCTVYYFDDIYLGQDPPPGISLDVTPPQAPVGVEAGP